MLVTVLPALANLGFGALILGQVFSQRPFSWLMLGVGICSGLFWYRPL